MLVTCVFTHCIYTNTASTNTVSTNTVPDTPSGATPTVQDVTASHAEHSEQGISYAVALHQKNLHQIVPYANIYVPNYQSARKPQ